jgi:hypothetical protein
VLVGHHTPPAPFANPIVRREQRPTGVTQLIRLRAYATASSRANADSTIADASDNNVLAVMFLSAFNLANRQTRDGT